MSDAPPHWEHIDFDALFRSGNRARVIDLTDEALNVLAVPPSVLFYRAKALLDESRFPEALTAAERGLELSPESSWGHAQRFESLLALGRSEEAFEGLLPFLQTSGPDVEVLKAAYVDRAAQLGRFDLAAPVNEQRRVIADDRALPRYAVAVQCFTKADTLDKVFASLVACRASKEFGLVILQDSAQGSRKQAVYEGGAIAVRETIGKWLPQLMLAFEGVEIILNPSNKGTAPSCRRLLDRVCQRFEGFLFIEDDCLLSPDALEWSRHHLQNSITPTSYWFATCESIFFDASQGTPSPEQVELLSRYAGSPEARAAYIELEFVPSTCFLTTKQIWEMTSNVRSFTSGPESLSRLMKRMNNRTLSPVTPRASDIGMLHELGYSVGLLGKENVSGIKNTFLMSGSTCLEPKEVKLYEQDKDRLFAASSKLDPRAISELVASLPS